MIFIFGFLFGIWGTGMRSAFCMVSEFIRRGSCEVIVILVCKFNFSMASFDIVIFCDL